MTKAEEYRVHARFCASAAVHEYRKSQARIRETGARMAEDGRTR